MAKVKVVYADTIQARDRANAMLLAGKTPDEVAAAIGEAVRVSEAEAGPGDNWPTLVYTRKDVLTARAAQVEADAKAEKSTRSRKSD